MVRFCLMAGAAALLIAATPVVEVDPVAAFETLRLSSEVARAGEKARDPWLMIAAARLRATAEIQPDPNAAARGNEWLARAEALGGDDPRVASVVADLKAQGFKGRSAGPRVSQELLRGGERRSAATPALAENDRKRFSAALKTATQKPVRKPLSKPLSKAPGKPNK